MRFDYIPKKYSCSPWPFNNRKTTIRNTSIFTFTNSQTFKFNWWKNNK